MTPAARIATARELLQHAKAREARAQDELAAAEKEGDQSGVWIATNLIKNNRRFMTRLEADLKRLEQ